jgi:hypothetical protein
MKKILTILLMFISFYSFSQVGISSNGSFNATETLDVDGNLKVRDTLKLTDIKPTTGYKWLVVNSTGSVDTVSVGGPVGPTGSTGTPATPNTADNGLTITGNNIQLGGSLSKNTTIGQGGFNFQFTGGGSVGIGNLSGGGSP